jgi:putative transposase
VKEDGEANRRRRSMRAQHHQYGWSASYFITILAKQREALFALPELRVILTETWQSLPSRFPDVLLDEFVVMPDHLHFIIHIRFHSDDALSLGRVVGAYKSLVSHRWLAYVATIDTTRQALPIHLWHRNYYDRVIRDERELETVRQYIRNNPSLAIKQQEQTVAPTIPLRRPG